MFFQIRDIVSHQIFFYKNKVKKLCNFFSLARKLLNSHQNNN